MLAVSTLSTPIEEPSNSSPMVISNDSIDEEPSNSSPMVISNDSIAEEPSNPSPMVISNDSIDDEPSNSSPMVISNDSIAESKQLFMPESSTPNEEPKLTNNNDLDRVTPLGVVAQRKMMFASASKGSKGEPVMKYTPKTASDATGSTPLGVVAQRKLMFAYKSPTKKEEQPKVTKSGSTTNNEVATTKEEEEPESTTEQEKDTPETISTEDVPMQKDAATAESTPLGVVAQRKLLFASKSATKEVQKPEVKVESTDEEVDNTSENDPVEEENDPKDDDQDQKEDGGSSGLSVVAQRRQLFMAKFSPKGKPELTNTGKTFKKVVKETPKSDYVHYVPSQKKSGSTWSQREAERKKKRAAAVKIQAMVRSGLARMRVCQMVEDMINGLLVEQGKPTLEPTKAQVKKQANIIGEEAAAIKLQSMVRSGLARMRVGKMVEEMINSLQVEKAAQSKTEEQAKIQVEKESEANFAKVCEEEEDPVSKLFVGPLQKQVGLLPEWWLELTPHDICDQDDFDWEMEDLWQREPKRVKPLTDPPAKSLAESPAEPSTKSPAESQTESPAKPSTDSSADSPAEPLAESPTESPKEVPTDATAQPLSEASTESLDESPVESPTEPSIETPSKPVDESSDSTTDATTETSIATSSDSLEESPVEAPKETSTESPTEPSIDAAIEASKKESPVETAESPNP